MSADLSGQPANIHPSAVVDAGAILAAGVTVGPGAVVGGRVRIGQGTSVGPGAVVDGDTTIGAGNDIGAHAVIGGLPQIRGSAEAGRLVIGRDNQIRELTTIHVGSAGGATEVGDGNFLMAYAHVAHDCRVGDGNELANGAQLAGHVQIGSRVVVGGLAAMHQFVRVGDCAMVAAGAMVSQDVPPYARVSGNRARIYGANALGLRRHGFEPSARRRIAAALRQLLGAPRIEEGLALVAQRFGQHPEIEELLRFVRGSKRGICRPVASRK